MNIRLPRLYLNDNKQPLQFQNEDPVSKVVRNPVLKPKAASKELKLFPQDPTRTPYSLK
jgi:hypothetical protein